MQTQTKLTLTSYAKVNLCLSVHYPPVDGYHLLESVFQTVGLHDVMHFESASFGSSQNMPSAKTQMGTHVLLDCGPVDVPVQDNLIFKAIDAMEQAHGMPAVSSGQELRIMVEKHIPAGGGLGGGSSNAASAMRAYGQFCDIDVLSEKSLQVARSLGADVAFFLYGGAVLMGGRGDILQRRLPSFPLPIVLMGESQPISTGAVYRAFDANPPKQPDAYALAEAIEQGAPAQELAKLCGNNLEPAAFEACSQLKQRVLMAREDPDVLQALVTGSGSTSYAICADEAAAQRFEQRIKPYCAWTSR